MEESFAGVNSLLRLIAAWDATDSIRERDSNDNCLIKKFLATGSNKDFDCLVNRHKNHVYRLVVSVLGPNLSAEAEDIAQDVFVQVYRKLSTFRMRSSFSTWIYRVTYNKAIEYRKKAQKRLPHHSDAVLTTMPASGADTDPAKAVSDRQQRRRILQCVEELDEPYRTVIYLHYWMNLPVSNIAEYLSTRVGTVKSYLHRARARIAHALKKEAEDA